MITETAGRPAPCLRCRESGIVWRVLGLRVPVLFGGVLGDIVIHRAAFNWVLLSMLRECRLPTEPTPYKQGIMEINDAVTYSFRQSGTSQT